MMNDQIDDLMNAVVDHGFRRTAARRAILETLVESGGHITADDLANQVRAVNPTIGRMTVYRTLDLLCELGIIRPIYQGTGAAHYVLLDQGSHHHLVCNRCSMTIEFEHCGSAAISQALSERYNFEIQAHLLEFFGLCEICQSQEE
jgi:Fur family ferric uptake transcriptional regulator